MPFPTQRVAAFYESNSITKGSKHPKEAAKLISYVSGPEQMERLVKVVQLIPPRTSVFTDALKNTLIKDWPWYKEFISHADNVVLMAPAAMPGDLMVEVQKIWGSYFDRVLFENMNPADAMNAAQKEAIALF